MPDLPPVPPAIVVTASRLPLPAQEAPGSVSVIDSAELARLGQPFVSDYLRLLPSAAVSISGPAGSLTEVRIRGAEANHTLLFIDGIRANDPAAGNAPRFELLNADIASRIEVVRGPQSALWGSEAIGGVIAVQGASGANSNAYALGEAGSFATFRGAAGVNYSGSGLNLALAAAGQRSRGTDAFDGTGDRDGYDNRSVRGRLSWQLNPSVTVGAAGFATADRSEFDGYSPVTFLHADTLDNSRNRLAAGRAFLQLGDAPDAQGTGATLSASWLRSSNRNFLDRDEINRTAGTRRTLSAEGRHNFDALGGRQRLVLAAEQEDETFRARDQAYGGATDQDRRRRHRSLTAEWRVEWSILDADLAVRRDAFNRFKDATTVRAALLAKLGHDFALSGAYGEGIAQPTFYDLYGFFPNSFVGNPALKPERSRGVEASLRWHNDRLSASLTAYRQRLRDEIVDVFDPQTFQSTTANATGTSRRQGVELEGAWVASKALRVQATMSRLHASEPNAIGGQLRETRRPKWTGAVEADGATGRFSYGASLAYSGARIDTDFDQFPAQRVRLGAYWLAGARVGYKVADHFELFARVANAFDQNYREVVGYRPSGRSVSGGFRVSLDR